MKGIVAIIVIVLVLVLIGWISFRTDDGRATIQLDTNKAQADTERVVEGAKDLTQRAAEGLDDAVNRDDVAVEPEPVGAAD